MKKFIYILAIIFVVTIVLFSQEQNNEKLYLTLNDCMQMALENNLDISVEAYNPKIRDFSFRKSKEIFMPRLSFLYNNWNYNQLTNWFMEGTQYVTKINSYDIGLRQDIITGGEFYLSLYNSTTDSGRSFLSINPSYSGELRFELKQPLLKNFGPKIKRKDIRKAKNLKDISVYQLESTIIRKIFEVQEAYWNLVRAIENLKVQEFSLEKSKERLKRNMEAARIGAKTSIDVLESQTQVASGEDSIITARMNVEMYEKSLRKIINIPADASGISNSIVPIDKPSIEKIKISFDEALNTALEERPELLIKQEEIENCSIDVSYSQNQLLPQLDLNLNLWYPGQSGDILIYRDNNPYTNEIVDRIKGSRADSFKDVFRLKYDNWRVYLNFEIPFSNFLSRASLAEARMQKEQKLIETENEKKSIYQELLEVFEELKIRERKLESSKQYKKLMERRLNAEEEKYRLGLGSHEWLFTYQERFVSAKRTEIGAIIDYIISVAKLERIMGINLKTKNLKFKNYDF